MYSSIDSYFIQLFKLIKTKNTIRNRLKSKDSMKFSELKTRFHAKHFSRKDYSKGKNNVRLFR